MKKRAIGAVIAAIVIAIAAGCSGGTIHDNDEVYFPTGFVGTWKKDSGYLANIRSDSFTITLPNDGGTITSIDSRYQPFDRAKCESSNNDRTVTITARQNDAAYILTDVFELKSDTVLFIDLGGNPSLEVELNKAN